MPLDGNIIENGGCLLVGDVRIFLSVLATCVLVGPLLGLLAAMLAEFAVHTVDWVATQVQSLRYAGELATNRPLLPDNTFLLKAEPRLLLFAYVAGGLQAFAGGIYLGARFSRRPPQIGPMRPLMAGLILGLLLYATFSPRDFLPADLERTLLLIISPIVHVVAAAGCWALARLALRILRPEGLQNEGSPRQLSRAS